MLYDEIESPDETTPRELQSQYTAELATVIHDLGSDAVDEMTDLDPETIAAIETGQAGDLDLRDAATILALDDAEPDADTILAEVRNHLLLQMSNAVLNVDVLAGDVDLDLSPKELQAKIEGRHPMTLAEYATIHHVIATEADW